MENMADLRPCPFCGGDEIYVFPVAASRGRAAMCQKCLAEGPYEITKEKAAEAWNRRAEPENRVLTLEEVKRHCEGSVGAAPLWMEFRHFPGESRWMAASVPEYVCAESIRKYLPMLECCTLGRCWLRKPTAEEMAHSPWGELPCTNH